MGECGGEANKKDADWLMQVLALGTEVSLDTTSSSIMAVIYAVFSFFFLIASLKLKIKSSALYALDALQNIYFDCLTEYTLLTL